MASRGDLALAVLTWLVVVGAAGIPLACALRRRFDALTVASAFPIALLSATAIGLATEWTGVPLTSALWWCWVGVLGALAGVVVFRRRTTSERTSRRARTSLEWSAVLASVVVGLGLWASVVPDGSLPDHIDLPHHAMFVTRIAETSSADPRDVVIADFDDATPAVDFYPLAPHVLAAMVSQTSGVGPLAATLSMPAVFGAVAAPIGVLALCRALGVGRWGAAAGVLASTATSMFPYSPFLVIGAVSQVVGLSLVTVTIAAVISAQRATSWSSVVLGGVCLAGGFVGHNSQIVTVGIAVTLATVQRVVEGPDRREMLRRSVAVAAVAAAIVAPLVARLVRGAVERGIAANQPRGSIPRALAAMVAPAPLPTFAWGVLAIAGAVVALAGRKWAWLAIAWFGHVGLALVAYVDVDGNVLTRAWYGVHYRIVDAAWALAPVLVAIAVDAAARTTTMRRAAAGLAVLALILVSGPHQVVSAALRERTEDRDSVIASSHLAAIAHLRTAVPPNGTIATESTSDGGIYLYVLADLRPLLGLQLHPFVSTPGSAPRIEAIEQLVDPSSSARAAVDAAERFCITHIWFNATNHPSYPRRLDREAMRGLPWLDVVFDTPEVSVFEVTGLTSPACEAPSLRAEASAASTAVR
jgi:hypothetical protein